MAAPRSRRSIASTGTPLNVHGCVSSHADPQFLRTAHRCTGGTSTTLLYVDGNADGTGADGPSGKAADCVNGALCSLSATGGLLPPQPITAVAYKSGTSAVKTIDTSARVVPGEVYELRVEVLRNDLDSAHEKVTAIRVDGKDVGRCNPDCANLPPATSSCDYACDFFDCAAQLDSLLVTATGSTMKFELDYTGHSWDCDCDTSSWECSKETTVGGRTPMTAVARITLTKSASQITTTLSSPAFGPSPSSSSDDQGIQIIKGIARELQPVFDFIKVLDDLKKHLCVPDENPEPHICEQGGSSAVNCPQYKDQNVNGDKRVEQCLFTLRGENNEDQLCCSKTVGSFEIGPCIGIPGLWIGGYGLDMPGGLGVEIHAMIELSFKVKMDASAAGSTEASGTANYQGKNPKCAKRGLGPRKCAEAHYEKALFKSGALAMAVKLETTFDFDAEVTGELTVTVPVLIHIGRAEGSSYFSPMQPKIAYEVNGEATFNFEGALVIEATALGITGAALKGSISATATLKAGAANDDSCTALTASTEVSSSADVHASVFISLPSFSIRAVSIDWCAAEHELAGGVDVGGGLQAEIKLATADLGAFAVHWSGGDCAGEDYSEEGEPCSEGCDNEPKCNPKALHKLTCASTDGEDLKWPAKRGICQTAPCGDVASKMVALGGEEQHPCKEKDDCDQVDAGCKEKYEGQKCSITCPDGKQCDVDNPHPFLGAVCKPPCPVTAEAPKVQGVYIKCASNAD